MLMVLAAFMASVASVALVELLPLGAINFNEGIGNITRGGGISSTGGNCGGSVGGNCNVDGGMGNIDNIGNGNFGSLLTALVSVEGLHLLMAIRSLISMNKNTHQRKLLGKRAVDGAVVTDGVITRGNSLKWR